MLTYQPVDHIVADARYHLARHWSPYRTPVKVGAYALTRTRAADGRTSRISPAGVPAWEGGASYKPGAVVSHRGELYTATRPVSGKEPGLSPGHWAPAPVTMAPATMAPATVPG